MTIVAKPKTYEVYDFLKGYNGLTNPNSFKYMSWLRDGKALVQKDPVNGYLLQGFSCELLGDIESAISSMKKLASLNDYFGKFNYASLLCRFGDFKKSYELCIDLLKQNPLDDTVFEIVLLNASFALDGGLIEQANNIYKGKNMDWESLLLEIEQENKLLQEIGIDKQSFLKVKKSMAEFLSRRYYGIYATQWFLRQTEIGNHLEINMYLNNVDIDKCLEMNDVFLDSLIDNDGLEFGEYKNIIVHFVPSEYGRVA